MTTQVTDTELLKTIVEAISGSPTLRVANITAMVDHMKRHSESVGTLSDAMTQHCMDNVEWVLQARCSDSDLCMHSNNLLRAYFFAHLRRRELVYLHSDRSKVTVSIEMVRTNHQRDVAFYKLSSVGPDGSLGDNEYYMFPHWKFHAGLSRRMREAFPNRRTAFGLASPHDAVDDNPQAVEPRVRRVVQDLDD